MLIWFVLPRCLTTCPRQEHHLRPRKLRRCSICRFESEGPRMEAHYRGIIPSSTWYQVGHTVIFRIWKGWLLALSWPQLSAGHASAVDLGQLILVPESQQLLDSTTIDIFTRHLFPSLSHHLASDRVSHESIRTIDDNIPCFLRDVGCIPTVTVLPFFCWSTIWRTRDAATNWWRLHLEDRSGNSVAN